MIDLDQSQTDSLTRRSSFLCFTVSSLWLLLGIATFGHIMMRPIEPNEHMYVAASVLSMDHSIYTDFPFLQMPNLPYLYAAIYRFTGTEYYLFAARLVTWFAAMMTYVVLAAIAWQFARSQHSLQAVLAAWILGLSESFILITGECSNYVFPVLLSLAAFWALLALPMPLSSSLSGLTLALAVGFKLYYVTLVPLFVVAVLWLPQGWLQKWWSLGRFVSFGFLGSIPSLLCFWRNPEVFLYDNVQFHLQTAQWYREINYHDRLSLFDKAQYAKSCLQHPSQMWIAFGFVAVLVECMTKKLSDWRWVSLALSMVAMSIVTALAPTPTWPQYIGMIVPFAIVLILAAGNAGGLAIEKSLWVGFGVGMIVSGPYYLRVTIQATRPMNWIPIAYHQQAREILRDFGVRDEATIATFMPMMVAEAGYKIVPEFANARFLYQVSEGLSDELAERLHTTSRSRLENFLDSKRPELIVTTNSRSSPANSPSADDDLERYAKHRGYQVTEFSDGAINVWRIGQEKR